MKQVDSPTSAATMNRLPLPLLTALIVCLSAGCMEERKPEPGSDGQYPQDIMLRALRAANNGSYNIANQYFTQRRLDELKVNYADEGGLGTYWDYMTSARGVKYFTVDSVDVARDGSVTVWVQKVRTNGKSGPIGHWKLVQSRGLWRIDG